MRMWSPSRRPGTCRNGPPAAVRCAVTMRLPTWPGRTPPPGPVGTAASPRSSKPVPRTSSGAPGYSTVRSPCTPAAGMVTRALAGLLVADGAVVADASARGAAVDPARGAVVDPALDAAVDARAPEE